MTTCSSDSSSASRTSAATSAYRNWRPIPVTVVDLLQAARGEAHENFVRKDLLPSEIVALKRAIEPTERRSARERQGSRADLCHPATVAECQRAYLLEAAGEGTKMADHLSPIFRPAFPSSAIISERSSPSRVRFAAPNNGAPLTAPGRSGQHS